MMTTKFFTEHRIHLPTERQSEQLGQSIASHLRAPCIIYLKGDLGAGKTTLVRALLRAMGESGPIKSPTYTLVEPYTFSPFTIYHFDLYRLTDPHELDYIGIRDYINEKTICIFEWPEHGRSAIPSPDLCVALHYDGDGREALVTSHTATGKTLLKELI